MLERAQTGLALDSNAQHYCWISDWEVTLVNDNNRKIRARFSSHLLSVHPTVNSVELFQPHTNLHLILKPSKMYESYSSCYSVAEWPSEVLSNQRYHDSLINVVLTTNTYLWTGIIVWKKLILRVLQSCIWAMVLSAIQFLRFCLSCNCSLLSLAHPQSSIWESRSSLSARQTYKATWHLHSLRYVFYCIWNGD